MENNYYGETTQLADVRLKENMDSLYEKTRLGLGDFEEIKAISEDVARKIDRVQEERSMKRINTQNIRLEKRIFWDYFKEETYGKTKLEDLKNEMKKSFGLKLDIQTEFKELCSKLERLTSLSYKEDLRHIVEFYVDLDFEDMKLSTIAEITSTNLSTTKSRLYKALKLLKLDLGGMEDDRSLSV